jgi:hypothetical protein
MAEMSLTEISPAAKHTEEKNDIKKWFETCFDQVYKTSRALSLSFEQDNDFT